MKCYQKLEIGREYQIRSGSGKKNGRWDGNKFLWIWSKTDWLKFKYSGNKQQIFIEDWDKKFGMLFKYIGIEKNKNIIPNFCFSIHHLHHFCRISLEDNYYEINGTNN